MLMGRYLFTALLVLFVSLSVSADTYFLATPVDSFSRENLKDVQLMAYVKGDTAKSYKGHFAIKHSGTPYEHHMVEVDLPSRSRKYVFTMNLPGYLERTFEVKTKNTYGTGVVVELGEIGMLRADGVKEPPVEKKVPPMRTMVKKETSLIEQTGLTDKEAVAIVGGKHLELTAFKELPNSAIASMKVVKDPESVKKYLTPEELSAGKNAVILVELQHNYSVK